MSTFWLVSKLALSLGIVATALAQPINESWLGVWESSEPVPVFNKKTNRTENRIERIQITASKFDDCLWSNMPRGIVGKGTDCHASYTGNSKTTKELAGEFGTSKFARHLAALSPENPFRVITLYMPAGGSDCGIFLIWDRGVIYRFHPQCPVSEDTRRIEKFTRVSPSPSEASSFTKCKTLTNGSDKYRLCIDGKRGSITRLSDSGQINFVLDKCVANSSNYVSSYTEKNGGIDMATYRSAIWEYCNKGW